MNFDSSRALHLLRLATASPNASFRAGQEEAIKHIIERRSPLLVIQKTGWGKSLVYFIATRLLRRSGGGPTILISPLLALMRNQIAAAQRIGVLAASINSDNHDEWSRIENKLRHNEIDILLISPERLANDRFRNQVLARISSRISLLVIDEAHCISDWGHDFRPHYRLLEKIVRTLPPSVRVLATTATANNRVMEDIRSILGPELEISRGDLNRDSLVLQTIQLPRQEQRLAWLAEHLPAIEGHGIIYTLTKRDCLRVTGWLKSCGIRVEAYTGETGDARVRLEQALLDNHVKALVATTALGMGFDKPDLAFVIHYQTPGSVVAYYQQVGRAGRALQAAYGILLSGEEENDINSYFIDSAFPTRDDVNRVLDAIDSDPLGLTLAEIMASVNLSQSRIKTTVDLLSLETPPPIVRIDSRWQLTPARLSEAFWQRTERLTNLRRVEQQQMQKYVQLKSGHMDFLVRALDSEPKPAITPRLPLLPESHSDQLLTDARDFLRRSSMSIEPRRMWPLGGMPQYGLQGKIPVEHQAQPGKALCVWGDSGWGQLVRAGKYRDGRFADELLAGCESLVEKWNPEPMLTWVTCIPSLRHPTLVPDFALRLANRLGLPFSLALKKTGDRPEQKTMANSTLQARNVDGSLTTIERAVLVGAVLLVDDMVDSRWTFTVATWLLRANGCGEVFPLALALTGKG
jgi:ATP-dependent DNA helicase RecQ